MCFGLLCVHTQQKSHDSSTRHFLKPKYQIQHEVCTQNQHGRNAHALRGMLMGVRASRAARLTPTREHHANEEGAVGDERCGHKDTHAGADEGA